MKQCLLCGHPGYECEDYEEREDALVLNDWGDFICQACDERLRLGGEWCE
jgi:hypothetical protein